MQPTPIIAVVAVDSNMGMGNTALAGLPWKVPGELAEFKRITTTTTDPFKRNAIVMGRKTWDSLPVHPLKDRLNIIVSRTLKETDVFGALVSCSLENALLLAECDPYIETIFIIGGEKIYREAISVGYCDELYTTHIHGEFDCNLFFPHISQQDWEIQSVYKTSAFDRVHYVNRKSTETMGEYQYLNLLKSILSDGAIRGDRTGTGTRSVFGATMRFNLSTGELPLLTTKLVSFRLVCDELLWMLCGSTNVKELQAKGIHIWDGNSSADFLAKSGILLQEGDIGPTYGFLMRHFGAPYVSCETDYTGQGIDQVAECIRLIKTDPSSRRIVMSLWNPTQLKESALPPCACFYQWYIMDGRLSCSVYQRSGDMMLGVPFNIASASLMTIIFAKICGLVPGDFIYTIGDAHIYENHIKGAKLQIMREPRPFPIVSAKKHDCVEDYTFEDFNVSGYFPMPSIKLKMAV